LERGTAKELIKQHRRKKQKAKSEWAKNNTEIYVYYYIYSVSLLRLSSEGGIVTFVS
jgi:hypothetical protein